MEYQQNFSIDELSNVTQEVLKTCSDKKIFLLRGELGAGKTTFVREFLRQQDVLDEVSSPTFTYLQVYKNSAGLKFFHFDLYRLGAQDDFFTAGFDEYLYQPGAVVLIEWPEIIEDIIEADYCLIEILHKNELSRTVKWTC